MAVTMKNAVFWDVAPCRSSNNRRFRERFPRSVLQLLVTGNIVPCSPILVTLMEVFSETSVLTEVTQCTIPEDSILQAQ
jgi:hypothetical protein